MTDKTGTTGTAIWHPSQEGLKPPSASVVEKQSAQHSEADFARDLGKVTQQRKPTKPS